MKKTLRCPNASDWRIELDASEIDPDDPGNGTPAMVYGPRCSGTFGRVLDTGEVTDDRSGNDIEVPTHVHRWLERAEDTVDAFIEEHTPERAAPPVAPRM